MKIQDIFFVCLVLFILLKKNYKLTITVGMICLLASIPLFAKWIFFTAEHLVWYAGGFLLIAIFQLYFTVIVNHENRH